MKGRFVFAAWLLLAVFVIIISGCKSVATNSAILRNQEGNYELAINLANQAIEQNPNDAEAYFQLGVSYSNLDSVSLAYDNFMKSLELDPGNKKRKDLVSNNIQHNYSKHYSSGQAAFHDRDFQAAVHEFTMATEADPRQSVAFYNLGVTYVRLAEADTTSEGKRRYHEKAIGVLDKSLEQATPDQSHYIDVLGLAGKELAEVGRIDEAIARFNRLIEEDPSNYAVIENLGVERFRSRDWKGAETFLKMAAEARTKIGNEDFKLYFDLGRASYFSKDEDPDALRRSIDYYKEGLDLEPEDQELIKHLIASYMDLEDWSNAIAWGEKFVSVYPDEGDGWRLLAFSYKEFGDKEKAVHCAEKYAEIEAKKNQAQ